MLIKASKTDVDFFNMSVGDTFTYKSKQYVVIGIEADAGFMVRQCVKAFPLFKFSKVHELYKD